MRDLGWTPADVERTPNRIVMQFVALFRAEAERASRRKPAAE